jgi:hypothetical protein
MDYAAIVAAVAGVISALVGIGKDAEAQMLREKMAAEYGDEILPDLDAAVAQEAGKSAFDGATEDTTGRRAQLDALGELDDVYQSGGRTDADQAAYNQAARQVAMRAASRAGGIGIETARRGGNQNMSALLSAQSGQDELEALAALDADIAASGRNRAFEALRAKSGLASGIRGDDWRSQEAQLSAIDLANRFNASQRQAAEMYNVGLPQQRFENRMDLISKRNAALEGVAAGAERAGAAARQTGAGIGNAALSYGQAWDWKQQKDKEGK